MSIFPKRSLPGKSITVHWSIGLESQSNEPLFPYFKLGIKLPDGKVVNLCKQNILLLPESYKSEEEIGPEDSNNQQERNNLSRNTPLLILADYLSGNRKRQKLVEILKRIRSSRHFYFTYQIPDNAPLGRYELLSELYLDGTRYTSLTAEEDFFFVEKITAYRDEGNICTINNGSPEPVPIKIIEYRSAEVCAQLHHVPALSNLTIELTSEKAYLLYNEERECLDLSARSTKKILRNQSLLNFEKKEGDSLKVYVVFPESDDAYILEGKYLEIWKLADGTLGEDDLKSIDETAYSSMMNTDLIHEL